ncbi:MAG: hypothetical protein PHD54_04660 [Desulfuromonadaceae bacterium]|nr:hypothetical protein [Desulfuromonadaceae bacterium]
MYYDGAKVTLYYNSDPVPIPYEKRYEETIEITVSFKVDNLRYRPDPP